MDPQQYLDHLARDSDLLADAAAAAGPDAPVPTCPEWNVDDLVQHCAGGDLWARTIVETGSREGAPRELPPDAPTGAALVPYFRAGAQALVQTLAATDPGTSVWTFSPADRTAAVLVPAPGAGDGGPPLRRPGGGGYADPDPDGPRGRRDRRVPHRVPAAPTGRRCHR